LYLALLRVLGVLCVKRFCRLYVTPKIQKRLTQRAQRTQRGQPQSCGCVLPGYAPGDTFSERARGVLCYLRVAPEEYESMAEKLVLVGVLPEIVVIAPDEQVVWLSDTGTLKIQFDPNRCPFQSNVFQAPPGRQLQSGPPRPGINPGSYKYRLWLNDQPIGNGEVILREK
jgi:hypothetical protein